MSGGTVCVDDLGFTTAWEQLTPFRRSHTAAGSFMYAHLVQATIS